MRRREKVTGRVGKDRSQKWAFSEEGRIAQVRFNHPKGWFAAAPVDLAGKASKVTPGLFYSRYKEQPGTEHTAFPGRKSLLRRPNKFGINMLSKWCDLVQN